MKLRLSCLVVLSMLLMASMASAGVVVQTAIYPSATYPQTGSGNNVSGTCPPDSGPNPGAAGEAPFNFAETANAGQHFSDPCAPYTDLFQDSGTLQPRPPQALVFNQFNMAGQVLTGVQIFVNTFLKTQQNIYNSSTGANTGDTFGRSTYVLGFGQTPTAITSQIFNQTSSAADYDFSYLMTNGGERFIIKQWQNMLTFDPASTSSSLMDTANGGGFNGEFGSGGGYHVTTDSDTGDVVPITIVGHTSTTTYSNSGGVANNIGASSLATSGFCTSGCPNPGVGFTGAGQFTIYAQMSGSVVDGLGNGVNAANQVAGSGIEVEIVYFYGPAGAVPEPGSLLLLGSGLAFVGTKLRRRLTR